MKKRNLLYLVGMLVVGLGIALGPDSSWALYRDYVGASSSGSLNQPTKVAVNGAVYVTDAGNKKVKKFSTTGVYGASFNLSVAGTPVGIAATATKIFVGDDTNNCVWIYNKSDGSLADLAATGISHKLGGGAATPIKMPNSIAVNAAGHILVSDGDSDKVYVFNTDGSTYGSFGTSGSGTSSGTTINMYFPSGIAMANTTNASGVTTQYVYVGDQGNCRVQKLHFAYNDTSKAITLTPTYDSALAGNRGDAFNQFIRLSDVIWDSVTSRLIVFDSLQMVGQVYQGGAGVPTTAFNYSGSAVQGYLNVPTGAAYDSVTQSVYVANNQSDTISIFNASDCASFPTATVTTPASALTPATSPYTVSVTAGDAASASTLYLFYDTNNSWSGGSKSLTPGSGEGIINVSPTVSIPTGTAISAGTPANIDTNWDISRLSAGTYYVRAVVVNAAGCSTEGYSVGTITVGDSNANGLNDIFDAMYPGLQAANDDDQDGLSNVEEQGWGTSPINADSDYIGSGPHGVSDGNEVAMGTNPLLASDDFNSAPSLVAPYFNVEWTANWKTWAAIRNTDEAKPAYLSVTFYRDTLQTTPLETKYFVVPANGTLRVDPYAYTEVTSITRKGSIEIRYSGGRCVGFSTQEKWNAIPSKLDYCYSCELATPADAATTLYGSFYNVDPVKWVTWYSVKNMSNETLTVSATLYDSTTGVALTGTGLPKVNSITAKAVWAFNPANIMGATNLLTHTKGNCIIKVTGGNGTILGYQQQAFKSQITSGAFDFGYTTLLGTDATLMSTVASAHWTILTGQYATWLTVYNPGVTTATLTMNYYDKDGNLKTANKTQGVNAKATFAFTPTAATSEEGAVEVVGVTGGKVYGYSNEQWVNKYYDGVKGGATVVNDVSIAYNLTPTSDLPTTLYSAYLRNNDSGFNTIIRVKNQNAYAIDVTLYFYSMNGTLVQTYTPATIPAHGTLSLVTNEVWRTFSDTEVSMKVVGTGGIMGYTAGVRTDTANPNPDASTKYEGSFGANLQR